MRKESLYIKVTHNNVERTFPFTKDGNGNYLSSLRPAVINTYEYTAERMGAAPTLTATLYYPICLDDYWTKEEYVTFNGERYYIFNTPSSSKANDNIMYKHEITFVSARAVLDQIMFLDVVTEDSVADYKDRVCSNNTRLTFYGTIYEFVARLNDALIKQGLCSVETDGDEKIYHGYHIVFDDEVESDEKEISFDSSYMTTALQEINNTFGFIYYFVGQTIHVGDCEHQIREAISYGDNNGLLSIEHTNHNDLIVRQITGMGSSDNISYYYPNDNPDGKLLYDRENQDGGQPAWDISAWSLSKLNANNVDVFNGSDLYWALIDKTEVSTFPITDDPEKNDPSITPDGVLPSEIDSDQIYTYNFVRYYKVIVDVRKIFTVNQTYSIHLPMKLEVVGDSVDEARVTFKNDETFTIRESGINVKNNFVIGGTAPNNNYLLYERYERYGGNSPIINQNDLILDLDEGHGIGTYIFNFSVRCFVKTHASDIRFHLMWNDGYDRATLTRNESAYGFRYNNRDNGRFLFYADSGLTIDDTNNIHIGDKVTIRGILWIPPMQSLMPSIYRESWGTERFYKALNIDADNHNQGYTDINGDNIDKNGTYLTEDGKTYYDFANVWNIVRQGQAKQDHDDIRPSIKGMLNTDEERMDVLKDIGFDNNDDDSKVSDASGNSETYVHPYFYIKLPKLDFNLFDQALEGESGYIEMTSGTCGACKFEIMTYKEERSDGTGYNFYNPVLLDENGNLPVGDYNTITTSRFNEIVLDVDSPKYNQSTKAKEVWIAVKKDNNTFGVVIPNQANRYKPSMGDTYVFTGVKMPQSYVLQAEKRLDAALMRDMKENNDEHFTFNVKYSRIWLERHTDYSRKLNENAILPVSYDGHTYPLYVQSYTIKVDDNILSEVEIDVSSNLTVGKSGISQIAEAVSKTFVSGSTNEKQSTPSTSGDASSLLQETTARQAADVAINSRISLIENSGYRYAGAYKLTTADRYSGGNLRIHFTPEQLTQKIFVYAYCAVVNVGEISLDVCYPNDETPPLFSIQIRYGGNIIAIDAGYYSEKYSYIGIGHALFSDYWNKYNGELTIGKAIADRNGHEFENFYAKKSEIVGVYRYKGSVATYADLPTSQLEVGDVYDVQESGNNYGWTGSTWDALGMEIQIDYPITDVRVNGDSVVANKVANIPVPTALSGLTNDLVAIEPYPSTLYNNIRNDIDALFSN